MFWQGGPRFPSAATGREICRYCTVRLVCLSGIEVKWIAARSVPIIRIKRYVFMVLTFSALTMRSGG